MQETQIDNRRFLVVVGNAVAREDLCDLLATFYGGQVDTCVAAWSESQGRYAAAFFDASLNSLVENSEVRELARAGVPVVVLDGSIPSEAYAKVGLHCLAQPFSTEDVVALLRLLGVVTEQSG